MYEQYYGFREKPFNLTPDPSFLYLSEKHKEAFAHLLYGIRNRSGFVMVTGEIGTGKTTICRSLLAKLDPETEIAFIFNPILSAEELLRTINQDFGIDSKGETVKDLIDELNAYLLQRAAEGKNCVLVIDEAQNLDPKVLEQVRLLSNLETETQKLLQIVLIGQPELAQMLATKELRQLNQRITARYHLKELDADETLNYIAFRLRVAGGRRKVRFNRAAVIKVYRHSGGTPRVINAVCDRALLIGYTKETKEISAQMVKQAIREVQGEKIKLRKNRERARLRPEWVSVAALLMMGAFLFFVAQNVVLAPRNSTNPARPIAPRPDAPALMEPRFVEAAPAAAPDALEAEVAIASALLEPAELATPQEVSNALAAIPEAESHRAALAALATAWNRPAPMAFPAADDAGGLTDFARANGMALFRHPATLDQIFAVNLPVHIILQSGGGPRSAALIRRKGDAIELVCREGEPLHVTIPALAAVYGGEAGYLWVDTDPGARDAVPWQSGGHVEALQARLNAIGLTARKPTGQFDADTADLVRKVQEAAGLEVDGVVGEQTRMVLASWDESANTPSLSQPALPEIAIARLFGLLVESADTLPQPAAPSITPGPVAAAASIPESAPKPADLDSAIGSHARRATTPEVAAAQSPAEVETRELGHPGTSMLQPDEAAPEKLVTAPATSHVPLVPRAAFGEAQAP